MAKQKLHPTIEDFKAFVKKHPKLVQEVRKGEKSWQELYEDWYLLGENDEIWSKYSSENEGEEKSNTKSEFMSKIFSSIKHVDMGNVQKQITNVGSAITTIQQVIQQFQGSNQSQDNKTTNQARPNDQPFAFRKD